jgi:DNA-directed RNA polymerase, mitochondrial
MYASVVRLAPLLSLVRPEKLSLITILELMRLNGSGGLHDGMKTARALISVGRAVELEYKAQMCRKNQIQLPSQPRPGEQSYFSRMGYTNLQARRVAAAKYVADAEEWTADWSQHTRVKIGSILVNCLMETAFVTRTAINKKTGEEV